MCDVKQKFDYQDGFVGISIYNWICGFEDMTELLKIAYKDLDWMSDCGYSYASIQICKLADGIGSKSHVHHIFERKESHLISMERNDKEFKEFSSTIKCRTCKLTVKIIISISSPERTPVTG